MNICRMDDETWWIGPTLEACIADYFAECGEPVEDKDAHELTGAVRTFREQLAFEIAAGGTFPRIFATTEW